MKASPIICRPLSPDQLREISLAEGIGALSGYSAKGRERQREALLRVVQAGGRVVAGLAGEELVGFVTLHPPGPGARWGRWPPLPVLELGGIEVARGYRRRGIARRMVAEALRAPNVERRIVYAVAYAWCWDLETTGLAKDEYRAILARLLGDFGFREVWTDDPDVLLDPHNLMLVRMGAQVPLDARRAFERRLVEGRGGWMAEEPAMILERR